MDAHKMTLAEIFAGNKILEVPFFQRPYVWGEEQWTRLLSDIEDISASDEPYFIGSVILKQQQTSLSEGDIRTIVDGQQRLTTLSILMKVLCLKTDSMGDFDSLFRRNSDEVKIRHNYNDAEVYSKIMNLGEIEDLDGTDKISCAYRYFVENVDPQKISVSVIENGLIFVCIDLGFNEDEQQIFDTINSLGVRLTTAELLKNYFFDRDDVNDYIKYWRNVFEKDEETKEYWDREITTGNNKRTYIDVFFFAYLQIKAHDNSLKIEDRQRYTKSEKLFDSYKQLIHNYLHDDKQTVLEELKGYATIFRNSIDENMLDQELPGNPCIERINALIFVLNTTVLIPYVLYIEKNVESEETRNQLYGCLESYIIRRIITKASTKSYNKLFYENLILNGVLTKEGFSEYIAGHEDRANGMPSDDEVREAFHKSKLTNQYAEGVLYMLESRIRDRKYYSTQLLGIRKYSLEHMMPKQWRNHWPLLDNDVSEEERDSVLLTLGNLTIITQPLNASIRDSDWETKKQGKGQKGGLTTYVGGIKTLFGALDLPEWNEDTINERAEELADAALKVWQKS